MAGRHGQAVSATAPQAFDGSRVLRFAANLLKLENARQQLDWTIL